MQRHGARTAAASAAAGSGAAASRTDTWPERWDAGPRDPGRYAVSRTRPEPRPTGLQTILDQEALLDMVLQQFTLEQARHLLAPVSRQLAARVRDESVQWKALTDFKFEFARGPDMQTVHELFEHAYPFYRRDALAPYAAWLLERLCNSSFSELASHYHHLENQWQVIFDCIPLEGQPCGTPGGVYRHSPEQESIRYKRWLATPNRRWDVVDMKTLSDKIERKCLELISPHCWQSWKDPPRWCESVCIAFREWQAKLPFAIDLNKIHTWSVLATYLIGNGNLGVEPWGRLREAWGRSMKGTVTSKTRHSLMSGLIKVTFRERETERAREEEGGREGEREEEGEGEREGQSHQCPGAWR